MGGFILIDTACQHMFCTLPQGDNATFVYSMLGCEERFVVDPLTGVITVSGLLDREKQETFSIVVRKKYSPLSVMIIY